MRKLFRSANVKWGLPLTAVLFVGIASAYGLAVDVVHTDIRWFWAITLVCSTMHFWYDGFIWSVRKKQV